MLRFYLVGDWEVFGDSVESLQRNRARLVETVSDSNRVDSSVQKRLGLLKQSASKDNDASSSIADLIILRFGQLNEKLKKI